MTDCRTLAWSCALAMGVGCGGPSAPEGVTALSIADPRDHWAKQGFVQLVPPVHLPSSDHQLDQVEIWAKLPEGSVIEEQPGPTGAPLGLRFPPGAMLDRVEYGDIGGKRYVVDVRGTRIAADGEQWFHVYRRGKQGLFGYEWARSDTAAHGRATDAMIERLTKLHTKDGAAAPAWIESVRGKNDCAACHPPGRPTNAAQGANGLVNRGTDASGFFTPWTLFAEEIPLERYGGHDRTETDPYTTIGCPVNDRVTQADDGRARCASGAVPSGRYDLVAALAAEDPRALQVCAGRTYLGRYMTSQLRQRLATRLQQCEDSRVTAPRPRG